MVMVEETAKVGKEGVSEWVSAALPENTVDGSISWCEWWILCFELHAFGRVTSRDCGNMVPRLWSRLGGRGPPRGLVRAGFCT